MVSGRTRHSVKEQPGCQEACSPSYVVAVWLKIRPIARCRHLIPISRDTFILLTSLCNAAASSTAAPPVIQLPTDKAMVDSDDTGTGTHFTEAREPEDDISSGGEIDPNQDGDQVVDSTKSKKKGSSFGYAFLIMLLTIAIAMTSVWFYRKYRVRQMQYREFEVRPSYTIAAMNCVGTATPYASCPPLRLCPGQCMVRFWIVTRRMRRLM